MLIDSFTRTHLSNWCRNTLGDESQAVVIEVALGDMDEADAVYLVDQGWWRVYDSLKDCPACTDHSQRDKEHCAYCSGTQKTLKP